jgi:hypothetical protein
MTVAAKVTQPERYLYAASVDIVPPNRRVPYRRNHSTLAARIEPGREGC